MCHASWDHIRFNTFFLLLFGRIVEDHEGAGGLWLAYIICGLGASIASYIALPSHTVSLGASGAVYGLFVVSVLLKLSWNWKNLLSVTVLGQFVVEQVWKEVEATTRVTAVPGMATSVNHLAHLAGAATGALMIWFLGKLPDSEPDKGRQRA